MVTTIQIDKSLKDKLDKLKIHHRETYNELITRLVGSVNPKEDVESLRETIEVMSDSKLVREIARSMDRLDKKQYGRPFKKIKEEVGI